MILVALLALAQAQADMPPADNAEAEVVVIAQRSDRVRWDWRVGKGGVVTKCKITKSSGDLAIDRIGCEATRICAAKGLRGGDPMRRCILAERRPLTDQLAAARAARRLNGN